MRWYVLRRMLEVVLVLVVVARITVVLMHTAPGGPRDQDLREGRQIPLEILAHLKAQYRLDRPLVEQFAAYRHGGIRGALGPSYSSPGDSVRETIGQGLGASVRYSPICSPDHSSSRRSSAFPVWDVRSSTPLLPGIIH